MDVYTIPVLSPKDIEVDRGSIHQSGTEMVTVHELFDGNDSFLKSNSTAQ